MGPESRDNRPAYVACAGGLIYAALKARMALLGEVGLPGLLATPGAGGQAETVAWQQAGNLALGLLAALVALAMVSRWGRQLPRAALLVAGWGGVVALASGAAVVLGRALGPLVAPGGGLASASPLLAAYLIAWAAAWGLMSWRYTRTSRGEGRGWR